MLLSSQDTKAQALLILPQNGSIHPHYCSLQIATFAVSGKRCRIKAFQQELYRLYLTHGDKVPKKKKKKNKKKNKKKKTVQVCMGKVVYVELYTLWKSISDD